MILFLNFQPTVIQRHQGTYYCEPVSCEQRSERASITVQGKLNTSKAHIFALVVYMCTSDFILHKEDESVLEELRVQ